MDYLLGEKRTGLDFFRLLVKRGWQKSARWCLVSYHFDESDHSIPDESVTSRIHPIPLEGDLLSSKSKFMEEFVEKIQGSEDPLALPFRAYAALKLEARLAFATAVEERYRDRIQEELKNCYWFLACGPNFQVVKRAKTFLDTWTDDEVWEFASSMGFAPFQAFAEDIVDDCHGTSLMSYPSITLQVSGLSNGQNVDIHFDTGCEATFLDSRVLSTPGGVPAPKPNFACKGTSREWSPVWSGWTDW